MDKEQIININRIKYKSIIEKIKIYSLITYPQTRKYKRWLSVGEFIFDVILHDNLIE